MIERGYEMIKRRKKYVKKSEKKLHEKWQSWVALITAIVVLLGLLFDLPENIITAYQSIFPSCQFNGTIVDATDKAIVGAEIIVQGKKGSGFTDDNGEFNFKVKEKPGMRVQMMVKVNGEIIYNSTQTLPGPANIKLKDKP
jgi:hypothetical protein